MEDLIQDLNSIENGIKLLEPLGFLQEVFHYTSIEGLKGILESKNFWVSHSYFMNDVSEVRYTYHLIIDIFEELINNETDKEVKRFYVFLQKKMITKIKFDTHDNHRISRGIGFRSFEYILSFSLNSDSMNLWSSFTKGTGYNLGFDFIKLNQLLSKNSSANFIPGYVVYSIEDQKIIIKKKITEFRNIFLKHKNNFTPEKEIQISNKFDTSIRLYTNFFKDPVFSNDEEFRIVFYDAALISHKKPNYRIKDNILIPFITALKNTLDLLPLNSITIGPINHSDLAIEGVTYFLADLEYNVKNINIKKSLIPLRY